MTVNLDTVEFDSIFQASVLSALTDTQKETMIKAGLSALMKRSEYGLKQTLLEEIFRNALREKTEDILKEWIETESTLLDAIKSLVTEAVEKMITTKREEMLKKITENIIKALTNDQY